MMAAHQLRMVLTVIIKDSATARNERFKTELHFVFVDIKGLCCGILTRILPIQWVSHLVTQTVAIVQHGEIIKHD